MGFCATPASPEKCDSTEESGVRKLLEDAQEKKLSPPSAPVRSKGAFKALPPKENF
jgi:hypothetical protein